MTRNAGTQLPGGRKRRGGHHLQDQHPRDHSSQVCWQQRESERLINADPRIAGTWPQMRPNFEPRISFSVLRCSKQQQSPGAQAFLGVLLLGERCLNSAAGSVQCGLWNPPSGFNASCDVREVHAQEGTRLHRTEWQMLGTEESEEGHLLRAARLMRGRSQSICLGFVYTGFEARDTKLKSVVNFIG